MSRPIVKIGQVWVDNDKRSAGRKIQVVSLLLRDQPGAGGVDSALVRTIEAPKAPRTVGRTTYIRLDRFVETQQRGYTLVEDV
jgi:hypothetical protein